MIVALGVIAIIAGLALIIFSIFSYTNEKENWSQRAKGIAPTIGKYVTFLLIGVACIVFAILLFTTTTTIPAGHRGVVLKWGGEVEKRVMNEGLNMRIPFVESVAIVDVRVQAHAFEKISAASKEMQTVVLTGKVNWHFDPYLVFNIYQNIGASQDFVNKILDSALSDFLKESTPKYGVNDILNQRAEIRNLAIKALGDNLSRYNIIIDDIYISDIQFSEEYLAAIEKQQIAERQVNTEKNLLEQKKIQADQAAAVADGEKRAAILKAEADKQSAILIAEGQGEAIQTIAEKQAAANKLLNESINQNLINYNYVNKIAPNINVMMLPSGVPIIMSMDSILNPTPAPVK